MLQLLGHRLFYTCAAHEFRLHTVTEGNVGKMMIWTALSLNMHYNIDASLVKLHLGVIILTKVSQSDLNTQTNLGCQKLSHKHSSNMWQSLCDHMI